jgi:16S rRNA (cytosine1402-N4)-methyltransferase
VEIPAWQSAEVVNRKSYRRALPVGLADLAPGLPVHCWSHQEWLLQGLAQRRSPPAVSAGRRHEAARPMTRAGAAAPARHVPVMLAEMREALAVRQDGVYLDGTFGGGGYSRTILAAGAGRVIGLDRDPAAVARGRLLEREQRRFTMRAGRFGDMAEILADHGIPSLAGIVLDLGLSSDQLADPARGFAFGADGPLDMRMSAEGQSAAELLEQADEAELADIIFRYGEERASRRIARAIVARRRAAPVRRTGELAALVAGVVGRHGERIDPATRTFQALRIHLNDEQGELERALATAETLLAPGGRLVVVAFHSLEDRMVKRFLAARAGALPRPSRHHPLPAEAPAAARFRLLTRQPLRPTAAEVAANPRARSARLRAAERLPDPDAGR